MPMNYVYKAKSRSGEDRQGDILAENLEQASARLRQQGLLVTNIQEKKNIDLKKLNIELNAGVSKRDLAIYCRQFATMMASGLSALQSLHVLEKQTPKKQLKDATINLIQTIQQGRSLSEGMAEYPKVFPDFMVHMVEAGEVGGVLDQVMERLASYYQREHETRQKIISALTYPLIILFMSVGVIAVLIGFVLPQFIGIYSDFGSALPLPTRIVLSINDFMRQHYLILTGVLVAIVLLIIRFLKTEAGQHLKDKLSFKIPVYQDLNRKIITTHFCLTMSTLLGSGVPIMKALETMKKLFKNHIVVAGIEHAQASIREGKSLSEPLAKMDVFAPMVLQMIVVGEETGMLEKMFERVATIYDYEVEQSLGRLTAFIEPLMILGMGVMVGFILLSVLLPMYSLSNVIK